MFLILFSLAISYAAGGSHPNFHRPVWSPDGGQLVFMSDLHGNWELYLMNVDGSGVQRLTQNPGFDGYAAFSPDGKTLVFGRDGSLWLLELVTRRERQLSQPQKTYEDLGASWAPDGHYLVFASNRDGNREIYRMVPADGRVERLTDRAGSDGEPIVAPDGNRMAYVSSHESEHQIRIMDLKSGATRILVSETENLYGLSFSPDGQQLAYNGIREGNYEILMVSLNDGRIRQLTHHPGQDHLAVFSPNGLRLVFTTDYQEREQIFLLEVASAERTLIEPRMTLPSLDEPAEKQ